MPLKHPGFIQDGATDSVAEFRGFVRASEQAASHLLAELARLQTFADPSDIRQEDYEATKIGGLYCRRSDDWAVFYRIETLPFLVTVVLVGRTKDKSFAELEKEAAGRLARLH